MTDKETYDLKYLNHNLRNNIVVIASLIKQITDRVISMEKTLEMYNNDYCNCKKEK